MLVRYRGINNEGVLERPGTKWRVLKAISTTLKCQFTGKCWKVDFSMPCKTKSRETFLRCLRTVRAVTLDTSRPPQFHVKYWKKQFLWKTQFLQVFPFVFCQRWTSTRQFLVVALSRGLNIHKYPWIPMDSHGNPWISMDVHEYPWISIDIWVQLAPPNSIHKLLVHLWQKTNWKNWENPVFH